MTALEPGVTIRLGPPRRPVPLAAPTLPAPIKGLGILPLHTRRVGDFDKPEAPARPPKPGGAYAPAPAPEPTAGSLNLRR
ncbi:hypothetical protein HKCCSP123_13685 [Rhodobacterales bacterium HKCCSP123]|nr:hypothetical protein [Rhodobacterales bacterium HKCCSP123]